MCRSASRAPGRRHRTAAAAARAAGAGHRARRRPSGRRSCGRRSTSGRSSSPRHRAGFCRKPAPRRCGTRRRATRHSAPISAKGWMTPISLCAAMTETSSVRSSSASARRSSDTRPFGSTGTETISNPSRPSAAALSSTHLCSVARVTMRSRGLRARLRMRAREMRGALQRQIVGLGRAGGEHDLARVGTDQPGDILARPLDRRGGFLAVDVALAVRVAELLGEIGSIASSTRGSSGVVD